MTVRGEARAMAVRRALPRPRVTAFAASFAVLAAVAVVSASMGAVGIPLRETMAVIAHHLHLPGAATPDSVADRIVWDVRLPRVVTAGIVGATLAASGVAYQGVFRNPLADPFLIGVAAGAGLGGTIAIVSPLPLDFYGLGFVTLFAFIGAVVTAALTYELARTGRTVNPSTHILAGVAMSSIAGAATSLLMMLNEDKISVIFGWLYGDFTTASWAKLQLLAPCAAIAGAVLVVLARQLDHLLLSEDEARALGLPVERLKLAIILTASFATAVCVSVSGTIGFVGLIVPHACRLVAGAGHRALLPFSMLVGASFLIAVDLAGRTVLPGQEVPAGILTAALGGPFFLVLLRHQRRLAGG
ncbi:MAG: iron ABC transporter permease [Dehalococcoidia bacterium]